MHARLKIGRKSEPGKIYTGQKTKKGFQKNSENGESETRIISANMELNIRLLTTQNTRMKLYSEQDNGRRIILKSSRNGAKITGSSFRRNFEPDPRSIRPKRRPQKSGTKGRLSHGKKAGVKRSAFGATGVGINFRHLNAMQITSRRWKLEDHMQ